jgi:TnpA family transposase
MLGAYPNLAGTFARPIRWELIAQQYDEMIKSTVALKRGTATAEAILKRDNSYNGAHRRDRHKDCCLAGDTRRSDFA